MWQKIVSRLCFSQNQIDLKIIENKFRYSENTPHKGLRWQRVRAAVVHRIIVIV